MVCENIDEFRVPYEEGIPKRTLLLLTFEGAPCVAVLISAPQVVYRLTG
jgi:hypothetical protein